MGHETCGKKLNRTGGGGGYTAGSTIFVEASRAECGERKGGVLQYRTWKNTRRGAIICLVFRGDLRVSCCVISLFSALPVPSVVRSSFGGRRSVVVRSLAVAATRRPRAFQGSYSRLVIVWLLVYDDKHCKYKKVEHTSRAT